MARVRPSVPGIGLTMANARFLKYDKGTGRLIDRWNHNDPLITVRSGYRIYMDGRGRRLKQPKLTMAALFGDSFTRFSNISALRKEFTNERACVDHVCSLRWKNGEFCPHCGGSRIYHFSDGNKFKCGDCREQFSIKVGTIFHNSKLPLRKWFMAIWFINHNHPKGTASTVLAKFLGVTQKTAWLVLGRLRGENCAK